MIHLDHVTKTFGKRKALSDLSLHVDRGELFGLLGHNGAGKSTAFGILLGQVRPDCGRVMVRGHAIPSQRSLALARVGAIFESPCFYDYLSGFRNLEIFTRYTALIPRKEIEAAVELVGLRDRIHDPVRTYSHGMRQRLGLAQSLLPEPELILLDEPTEGLDPEGIHEIRNLILRLHRERQLTVLLSSHLLAEVEMLCGRVAILREGELLYDGPWREIAGTAPAFRLNLDDWALAGPVLERADAVRSGGDLVRFRGDPADLIAALVHAGVRIRSVEPHRRTLEELYLEVIGRP